MQDKSNLCKEKINILVPDFEPWAASQRQILVFFL